MKKLSFLALASILLVLAVSACELSDPCDPGQEFKYGVCIIPSTTPPPNGGGGESGCEQAPGGAGGEVECVEPPNAGATCTEGGDECVGETVCGAPQLPQCVALCGPGDPFEGKCPDGLSCTDFGEAIVCF
jgi:hypothetical protein